MNSRRTIVIIPLPSAVSFGTGKDRNLGGQRPGRLKPEGTVVGIEFYGEGTIRICRYGDTIRLMPSVSQVNGIDIRGGLYHHRLLILLSLEPRLALRDNIISHVSQEMIIPLPEVS